MRRTKHGVAHHQLVPCWVMTTTTTTMMMMTILATRFGASGAASLPNFGRSRRNFASNMQDDVLLCSNEGGVSASASEDTGTFNDITSPSSAKDSGVERGSFTKKPRFNRFLRSLWKGITLPFPSLRKVLLDTEKKQNMQVGLGLRESLAAVVSYLAVGVAAYGFVLEPSWTIVDAMYFTVTCFTTVGYGDLCPSNLPSKVFTCVFGLAGVSFLGAAIATVSGSIVDSQVQAIHLAKEKSRNRFKGTFDDMHNVLKTFKSSSAEQQHAHYEKARGAIYDSPSHQEHSETNSGSSHRSRQAIQSSLPSLFMIFAGGCLIHHLNGGNGPWWDAVYFSIITASTIGLGDISPISHRARIAAIVYIPVAVAAAGELLSGAATALIERRQQEVYRQQLEESLTITTLENMDADGSGRITRAEYLKFMLTEMGMVDQSELDELDKQFDRLDMTKSGYLDKEDLALMAKYKGVQVVAQ